MKNLKTLAIAALAVPALAACGTGYTNSEASGYGYDRDNMKGNNVYLKDNDSYMNYQMKDTHCKAGMDCKGSSLNKASWTPGMTMPDGGKLMKAKSSVSYADAMDQAQANCSTATGVNFWNKKMWDGKYVVRYTCFNR